MNYCYFYNFEFFSSPPSWVIADFGCGEAKIAHTICNEVHSFDFVAANDKVIACDMACVPLGAKAVDVVFQFYVV